jgi:hypothetical protein
MAVWCVLLLVLAIGVTDSPAQTPMLITEYPDGNVGAISVIPGVPFDSTMFLYWHLEVDEPAPIDFDISIIQIGTFKEFERAFWLDFIDIHEDGTFHFDLYVSEDGANFTFVDEFFLSGS